MKMLKPAFGITAIMLGVGLAIAPLSLGSSSRDAGKKSKEGLTMGEQTKAHLDATYGNLPLYFIQNEGQVDARVEFYEKGPGHSMFFTTQGAFLRLENGQSSEVVHVKPLGAAKEPNIVAEGLQAGRVNYFIGDDPQHWRADVPTYGGVVYQEIYPGIDMKFYGNNRQLEYDLVVKPGAEPSEIRIAYEGVEGLRIRENGDLEIGLKAGKLIQKRPNIYQEINGTKREVQGEFTLLSTRSANPDDRFSYGFEIAAYDVTRPLIIDPILIYSTHLGGSNFDSGFAIAVDSSGNAYVTGRTNSTDFPTVNPIQTAFPGGSEDVFVTKFNPAGSGLIYSTYLGGSGADFGFDIAVDSSGSAYVIGTTGSPDFPIANPFQAAYGGANDAFVAKIDPTGSLLSYSTYIGGYGVDEGKGVAIDTTGAAYIAGVTYSANFPTVSPFQSALNGPSDAFVSKVTATGSTLAYSSYLGGAGGVFISGTDSGNGIAVDGSGNAYVTGFTDSINFPTVNPLQGSGFGGDAFIAKVNATGSALMYSTYLGGSGVDSGDRIAVASSGDAFITGWTTSTDFPTASPLQAANGGGAADAFVTKINAAGSALVYSTYLGGSGSDSRVRAAIALEASGEVYVTGETSSANFPTLNPLQSVSNGGYDAFVTKIDAAGSSLVYSTYLGGSGDDLSRGIAVDAFGNAYVTGVTHSIDFPTANSFQTDQGAADAFVTKIGSQLDLVMTQVIPDAVSVVAGRKLSVTDTVQNRGIAPAGTFTIAYRLSQNTIFGDGDDVTITKTRSVLSLAAGASNTVTTSLTIPRSTQPGNYYVCAKADSTNAVTEDDETNNARCSEATIAVFAP